jgi:hypothetical protein
MAKPKVYLDTSVPGAYLDSRWPERQVLTQEFWRERLPSYEPVISVVVLEEIRNTPNPALQANMEALVERFIVLPLDIEAEDLAAQYLKTGIFPTKYSLDAQHAAIASVHRIEYLASWNFKHLVKVATRRQISLVNSFKGYGNLEIVAPAEL